MKAIIFCCLSLVIWSCSPRLDERETLDCSNVLCISGDGYFAVRLIDKVTGADLILDKSIDTTGMVVANKNNDQLYVANRMGIDSLKTAIMFGDRSQNGTNLISIKLKARTINFSYQYSGQKEQCCVMGNVQNILVQDHGFEVYRIGNYPANFKVIAIKL